jgi:cytochrome c-type biogenesis protein
MTELQPLLEEINALTPFTVALVALAGLVVGVAPSSFPLLSVAAGFGAGSTAEPGGQVSTGLRLATGFVLGIVTVDTAVGALFGLAGFAVLRALVGVLWLAYAAIGALLVVIGLALLRVIHFRIPVLNPSPRPVSGFVGSYVLGLPFGLSTCPACTPLMLPVVAAAAATADPLLGGALMFAFGLARGMPVIAAGAAASFIKNLRHTRSYLVWMERAGGVLMLAAALYFFYQSAIYAGWVTPP